MNTELADAQDFDYFLHSRREIEPLLPASAARILEIGCGSGATLAWLKEKWPSAETFGVDGFAPILDILRKNCDAPLIHDLNQPLPELGRFDLILALDVLEHLQEPTEVLSRLSGLLTPNGRVIVSVPNIAHYSILKDLLLKRRFEYTDAGILDRTHLRFFTEESAIGLMNDAGLEVTGGLMNGFAGPKRRLANAATLGMFKHYLATQYIMAGRPGGKQSGVRWEPSRLA